MFKKITAILITVCMVISLSACKKTSNDFSSSDIQIGNNSTDENLTDISENENSSEDKTNTDLSANSNKTSGNNTSNNPTLSTENTTNIPTDNNCTTIQFAFTSHNFSDDGVSDYVIKKFEEQYGIKVELVYCSMDNYANKLSGLISAGKAPTVGCSNGDYPACLSYFQSLDNAKIDYTDKIWNQNTFKLTTYNGTPYMCDTVGNCLSEFDIIVYSKSALASANCPTPEELDKAGNWNFDSLLQICEKLKQKDVNSKGISFHNYDVALNIAGSTLYKLGESNLISNGIGNDTTAILQKLATAKKDGYITFGGANDLISGKVGIITESISVLRKNGNLKNISNINDIDFYYLPAYERGANKSATGIFKGWGIVKNCNQNSATGSKSAVAGGVFLRYYLDVNNYNIIDSFISVNAANFFYEFTSFYSNAENYKNYNPYLTYNGYNNISEINPQRVVYTHINDDPSQIPSQMASIKSKVQNGVDNLNDYIIKNVRTR